MKPHMSTPSRALVLALLACIASVSAPPGRAADAPPALTVHEAKAREILARLISMQTTGRGKQVPAAAEYLADELRKGGFPAADVRVLPLHDSASLVARYRGTGKGGRPILLLAHMDVVEAKPSDWQRDPFTLVEENGFFFGRGTEDDKGGATAIVSTFLRLKSEGFVPSRDLILYFSGDEETAQFTTLDTVRNHRELIDAEFALNSDAGGGTLDEKTGEPLHYAIQTAEKTYVDFELTTRNPGGHSSAPTARNAIYDLAAVLGRLSAYRFPVMWNETTLQRFRVEGQRTPGPLGDAMRRFAEEPLDTEASDLLSADPAYVGQVRTTCVPTLLAGGHAANALPQSATATVNCRVFPGVPIEVVKRTLTEIAGPEVELKMLYEPIFSDASPLRDDVIAAVTRAVQKRYPAVRVVPAQGSSATDGAVFRGAGIPTYGVDAIFMKNSDSFQHGLNERIPVRSFYEGLQQWHTLVKDLAGPQRAKR